MSHSLPLPPIPTADAIEQMLENRIQNLRLSRGMIAAFTNGTARQFISRGTCNGASDSRVREDTLFEIGSITKLFTALLLAEMTDRKEVELDEPVVDLLPAGVRAPMRNGKKISLRDLVTHRSGLPRRPPKLTTHDLDNPYADYTANDLYSFLEQYRLHVTPGEVHEYSNLGFGILGHALALRAGLGYEKLIRARVLTPLDMHNTVDDLTVVLKDRFASPHDSSLDPLPIWKFGVLAGAGALLSTAADLLQFLEALGNPLSPISSFVPLLIRSYEEGGFGFGITHPDGGVAIAHSGGTGGSRSYVRYIPDWKRGVVVLSNSNIDAVVDLGVHIADTRYQPLWFRREVSVNAEIFSRLVGNYQIRPYRILEVSAPDGRLFVRSTGEPTRVFPLSEWHFFYKAINAQITFEEGNDGRAARLILHENGHDQLAVRIA